MSYPPDKNQYPDGNYLPVPPSPYRPTPPPAPPPLAPPRQAMSDTQEFRRPSRQINNSPSSFGKSFPQIPTGVVFFPPLRHELVVAYNAQLYALVETNEDIFQARFQENLMTAWRMHKQRYAKVSLSKTFLLGHSRRMVIAGGMRRVKGYAFFHQVDHLLFVSWRVVYLWRLSPIKLTIVSMIVSVGSFLFWLGVNLSSRWFNFHLDGTEWAIIFFVLGIGWSLLGGTIGVLNMLSGGFFLEWLRERFDEAFRDDVYLMYGILESTAEMTATELDVEQVNIGAHSRVADFSRRVPRL